VEDVLGSIALIASEKHHVISLHSRDPAFAVKFKKRLLLGLKTGGDIWERLISGQLFLLARHSYTCCASLFGFDLMEHLYGLGKVGLEVAAHDVEDLDQHGMPQGVEDLVALLPIRDQLPGTQDCQMLGKVGLLDGQAFLNLTGRKFTVSQRFNYGDSGGVRESLKNVGFVGAQLVLHYPIVFDISNISKQY
jgi:hypothetical protein